METPNEYERKKPNHDQPVDVWQLDLSVHNGSGRPLDHLIARYDIRDRAPAMRPHRGRGMEGHTPYQVFKKGIRKPRSRKKSGGKGVKTAALKR